MTYIFLVTKNNGNPDCENGKVYVRTTDFAMSRRKHVGGFTRFIYEIYDYTDPGDVRTEIEGKKIMNIKEFDQWRKNNDCF